jgi:hypothetical protein
LNQREGERGNRREYRSQSWVENINMTKCTCIQYIYSHREGVVGRGVEPERRGEGQHERVKITKLG